jgi:outer membrane protein TolC
MRRTLFFAITAGLLGLSGCMVGPNYKTPPAIMAPAFKETTPTSFSENDGWKPGQPSDSKMKGDWWTLFQDTQLNQLEMQVDTANQTLKEAEANFRAARAQIGFARSNEAPTIGVAPSISTVRDSANEPYFPHTLANNGRSEL